MKTSTKIILVVVILLIISGGIYGYLFLYGPGSKIDTPTPNNPGGAGGFVPLTTPNSNQTGNNGTSSPSIEENNNASSSSNNPQIISLPKLRLLSKDPVGGYGASTTASTTVIRWVDRGRGNIFEARGDKKEITTLSNTLLPRTYEGLWNKNLTAFIGVLLPNNSDIPKFVYARLNPQSTTTKDKTLASTTATSTENTAKEITITPYNLKGKNLPENIVAYAISPRGDKLFMFIKENNQGVGYIANFDGTSASKIFVNPLTAVNVEWPEDNTIAITTKGSATYNGYLYFVNPKTGIWKKVLGPILGLGTKVSKDAKYVFTSQTGNNNDIVSNIYKVGTTSPKESLINTLADKCVWGNAFKELIYCAVPSDKEESVYPDNWYKGTISFTDKIWQLNAKDGEVKIVSPLYDQADRLIDAFNLGIDPKDSFLLFMNKKDLTLWSIDLNAR